MSEQPEQPAEPLNPDSYAERHDRWTQEQKQQQQPNGPILRLEGFDGTNHETTTCSMGPHAEPAAPAMWRAAVERALAEDGIPASAASDTAYHEFFAKGLSPAEAAKEISDSFDPMDDPETLADARAEHEPGASDGAQMKSIDYLGGGANLTGEGA
jgi:hypothetical protein